MGGAARGERPFCGSGAAGRGLAGGGGWYFQSVSDVVDGDEDYLTVLDALAKDVGVTGVFSDWPATVTFYANCMDL